jgi:hypothetical protein
MFNLKRLLLLLTLATGWLPAYAASVDLIFSATTDTDGDGVFDDVDNCTYVPNSDQRDTNNNGYGNVCDGDLNLDHFVNALDLGLFLKVYGTNNQSANFNANSDFNGDGLINFIDKQMLYGFVANPPGPGAKRSVAVIMLNGHALMLDSQVNPLNFDQNGLADMQAEILSTFDANSGAFIISATTQAQLSALNSAVANLESGIAPNYPLPGDVLFLQAAEINLYLNNLLSQSATSQFDPGYYALRSELILDAAYAAYGGPSASAAALIGGGLASSSFTAIAAVAAADAVDYATACKDAGVPLPPELDIRAPTATAFADVKVGAMLGKWQNWGNLTVYAAKNITDVGTNNMVAVGLFAQVLTYTPPKGEDGACVALPRMGINSDNKFFVSLAGIICQGKKTGNACFWDSTWRSDNPKVKDGSKRAFSEINYQDEILYPVAGATPANMNDGYTFKANGAPGGVCTNCHTGSTVYNIVPDHPVWKSIAALPAPFATDITPARYTPILANALVTAGWKNIKQTMPPTPPPIAIPAEADKKKQLDDFLAGYGKAWDCEKAANNKCGNCHETPNVFALGQYHRLHKFPGDAATRAAYPGSAAWFFTVPQVTMPPGVAKPCEGPP